MRRTGRGRAARALRAGAAVGAVVVGTLTAAGRTAAAQTSWAGVLSGAQQVPVNTTSASGFTLLTLSGNLLAVTLSWTGLTGGSLAAAHIHCCILPGGNANVAVGFTGIPNAASGTYSNTFDLTNASIYTSAFLTASGGTAAGAEAALIAGLNAGQAYVNVHDATYPGGEIRANVVTTPEPTTFALAALGVGGAGLLARRRARG